MEYTSIKSPGPVRLDNLLQAFIETDPDFLRLKQDKRVRTWKRLKLKTYRRRCKVQNTRYLLNRIGQAAGYAAVGAIAAAFMAVCVFLI